MSRLVSRQSLNNLAQAGQGKVDTLALSESMSRIGTDSCLPVPLTASKINKVQLCLSQVLVAKRVGIDYLQVDGEDGVGAGGVGIHGSC